MNKLIVVWGAFFFCFAHSFEEQYRDIFENKVICVTGGAGFLGRALLTSILRCKPKKIIVFSRDEVKHAKLLQDFKGENVVSFLGDIRDYKAVSTAFKNVDIVIHAAALKRIDLLEYNVPESIFTNIIGTQNIVQACRKNGVKKAVFVSTDKACSPVNTYGACKFVSEKIFTNIPSEDATFIVVRYGNVLQSTGSVIPFFLDRIKNNQDILLTDPKMTRFFITKERAVELIFQGLRYGKGGEVFVPHIPSFKIVDLIESLQELQGVENKVSVIGLRPGEKIHEIMINESETPRTYQLDDIFIITPTVEKDTDIPEYITRGSKVNHELFVEYSSGNCLLPKRELISLLKEDMNFLKVVSKN